ncbi:MAG TPA: hypothetical protein VIX15_03120, partial [Streptosporangiaceae bacterium]
MIDLPVPGSDTRDVWEIYLSPTWMPALLVADKLGVLESIAAAPGSTDELSARLGLNGRALGSVLALLGSLGYLVPRHGRYHVTDGARHHLLPSSPLYWGGVWAAMRQDSPLYDQLLRALTTPDPVEAMPQSNGRNERSSDGWASGRLSPEAAVPMMKYMHSHSAAAAVAVAQSD